ncbi:hypothetical protein CO683_00935 [Bradyrhizobium ottawaense]|uniref:hypothetical protein n=1 Tax=Bradyrhizobium ottawaense TaxID=931866 RepID=UPI000BE86330|nr:hypothetical protein [Bradyrhizobium ottawaense]PDT71756.1 hypothetical protein CO683_00935 [Bradyrhizobium ottawaense]
MNKNILEKLDDLTLEEEVGVFGGSGQWIALGTVEQFRRWAKSDLLRRELLSNERAKDDFFNMLWKWFEERRGVEDMRANLPEGLSADDFKNMLDEHEANLTHS